MIESFYKKAVEGSSGVFLFHIKYDLECFDNDEYLLIEKFGGKGCES